nr:RNA polymerase sigma factor [Gracilibacillus massiliensis]
MQAGNKQALRILIERYKHHVFKVTLSVVHNEKDAEDLAQETFIKMIDALSTYQSQGFKTWISRIALHKAIDFKRKRQRQQEDLDAFDQDYQWSAGNHVEKEVLEKEKNLRVRNSLEQIPEKLRLVVHYYYLKDYSYKQIAEKLMLEESTVKMRLYRARNWMKQHWKEEDF